MRTPLGLRRTDTNLSPLLDRAGTIQPLLKLQFLPYDVGLRVARSNAEKLKALNSNGKAVA